MVFMLMLILSSCGEKEDETDTVPENILNEESFARVLIDFAMAESATNLNVKNVNLPAMDTVYAFDPLKFNNVRKTQYDSTLRFYSQHPELYKKAYELVLAGLTALESERAGTRGDSISK